MGPKLWYNNFVHRKNRGHLEKVLNIALLFDGLVHPLLFRHQHPADWRIKDIIKPLWMWHIVKKRVEILYTCSNTHGSTIQILGHFRMERLNFLWTTEKICNFFFYLQFIYFHFCRFLLLLFHLFPWKNLIGLNDLNSQSHFCKVNFTDLSWIFYLFFSKFILKIRLA